MAVTINARVLLVRHGRTVLNAENRRWGSVDRAPGVESTERVLYRVSVVLMQQFDFLGPRPVVLVSHDAVNRALLAHLDPTLGPASIIGQRTACWNELVHVMGDWRVTRVDQKPRSAAVGVR